MTRFFCGIKRLKLNSMKYIFVSGGVVSGLGKGITASSLSLLLKSAGFKVTNVKIDMYLNLDAGTIRPQEHGEVFVTTDGLETDQDLGNYERFSNISLKKENYLTTGQVYLTVINKERAFKYEGEDVEAIPHITDEIIGRITKAGKINHSEIVIIELGGTVGEYQNGLFFEANRILKWRLPKDVIHVHVTYLPVIHSLGELKSKPAQQSTHILIGMGIQPDLLIARAEKPIDQKRKEKLALFCNLKEEDVISNPDLENIYQVPLNLESQNVTDIIIKKLHLHKRPHNSVLKKWRQFADLSLTETIKGKKLKVALVGKYFNTGDYKLSDSYVSVIEALKQSAYHHQVNLELCWIDSEELAENKQSLKGYSGIIVPQGWGKRGVEGKLKAIKYARTNKIPYLGLCFGMQMAVIEFARNVLHLKDASSQESEPKTPYPVIHIMPSQAEYLKKHQYGGTIRLGSYPCVLDKDSLIYRLYKEYTKDPDSPWYQDLPTGYTAKHSPEIIFERHRHRYEFNNEYRDQMIAHGLKISGTSPDGQLVEAVELPDHPFFIGTQFHPEYISRPLTPHPIFLGFIKACKNLQ